MTTKFKILSAISFIALAVVLTFVGVWALTDLDFTVGGNIEYTAPAPEPVTPDEVSYLTFEYYDDMTAQLTACSSSAPGIVEIPSQIEYNNQTYTVTSIAEGYWDDDDEEGEGIFYGTSVKDLYIPDSVTSIGNYAFLGCSFASLSIGESIQQDFSFSCNAFRWATIQNLTIRNGVTRTGKSCFSEAYVYNIKLPNTLKEIGGDSFYYNYGLTSVTIPDSVTNIGDFAFSNCTRLTSVTIGSGVASIGNGIFSDCTGLTSITIPDSVTSIGANAFSGCTALVEVEVKAKTVPTGGYGMFDDCHTDLEIKVPSASFNLYKSAEYWKDYNIVDGGF